MKKTALLMPIIVCLIAFATSPQAMAKSYDLDVILEGTGQPSGEKPWLIATFDDKDSNGEIPENTVWLTMNADNLGHMHNAERVTNWYFNYNPLYNATIDLYFDRFVTFSSFEVDGAGVFDFVFSFSSFKTGNEKVTITLQGSAENENLTAASFDFLSQEYPDLPTPVVAPNGVQNTVAYVMKPATGGFDGFIGNNPNPVPEPATLLLLGVGIAGLAGFGRKKLIK